MINYMKCIKTGCDVICDDKIFHGDLFFKNGVLVLSGVPNESWNLTSNSIPCLKMDKKPIYYHFQAHNFYEIPCSGNFSCFMIENVFDVQDKFLMQIKQYESKEVIELFEGK